MGKEESIFLGSSLATSREVLLHKNVDLETDEGIKRMFELAEKIYKHGIVNNFLDIAFKELPKETTMQECPKCRAQIPISWKQHFSCGWGR